MINKKPHLWIPDQIKDPIGWYDAVLFESGLGSYSAIKGCFILKPYGMAIWEAFQHILNKQFKKLAIVNVNFPLLMPLSLLEKEQMHVQGFMPEVAIVTKLGNNELAVPLIIRPTSEALFCEFFKKEVESYKDLPLLYNQWVNVFRCEKNPRPFLRSREFLWQEGHTVHNGATSASLFAQKMWKQYQWFFKNILCIAVIAGKKTQKERFAGAVITYTIEVITNENKFLQSATSHYLGQNFSKAFDIKFLDKDNILKNAYQTSWGISTRAIGALILSHGDARGLVLPPKIAPILMIIIPVSTEYMIYAHKIKQCFARSAFFKRIYIDISDDTFGKKIVKSEIKGIPIRIEIGASEQQQQNITVFRRDKLTKELVQFHKIKLYVINLIKLINKSLLEVSEQNLQKKTFNCENFDKKQILNDNINGVYLLSCCNKITCEQNIEKKYNLKSRCLFKKTNNLCFNCNQKALKKNDLIYFGKDY